MTKLEKEIEAKLIKAVAKRGGKCLKWVCPGHAGVPDRILIFPNGVIFFAEIKRPTGGVISPRQLAWSMQLTKLGFWTAFIKDEDSIDTLMLMVDDELARRRMVIT